MRTLEEEIIIPLQRQMAAQKQASSNPPATLRLWPALCVAGLSFIFGIALASLALMKNQMGDAWRQGVQSYDWLVMAEGDAVAIDEVGRFLRKIDGVSDVAFISPDDVLQKAEMDAGLAADLALLEGNPFPAGWNVHWKAGEFNPNKIQEALQDVRSFPGVVDAASDPKALEKIHLFRVLWLRAKLASALLMAALVLFLSVAAGRFLFRPRPGWFGPKSFAAGTLIGVLSGAAGASLVYLLW